MWAARSSRAHCSGLGGRREHLELRGMALPSKKRSRMVTLSVPVHTGIVQLPKIRRKEDEEADFTDSNISSTCERAHFGQETNVYGDKANAASENDTKNDIQAQESMLKSMLTTDLQQFPVSL